MYENIFKVTLLILCNVHLYMYIIHQNSKTVKKLQIRLFSSFLIQSFSFTPFDSLQIKMKKPCFARLFYFGGAEPRLNSVDNLREFIRNLPLTEAKIPNSLRKTFLIGRRAIKKMKNINEL